MNKDYEKAKAQIAALTRALKDVQALKDVVDTARPAFRNALERAIAILRGAHDHGDNPNRT